MIVNKSNIKNIYNDQLKKKCLSISQKDTFLIFDNETKIK